MGFTVQLYCVFVCLCVCVCVCVSVRRVCVCALPGNIVVSVGQHVGAHLLNHHILSPLTLLFVIYVSGYVRAFSVHTVILNFTVFVTTIL